MVVPLNDRERRLIASALACFVLAALSGVLFRVGMQSGWTASFTLANIRHAHSHLMYFSWATPSLFVLLHPGSKQSLTWAWIVLVLGVLSYPLFLLFGYESTQVASLSLPPAVVVSGLIMLAWYGWIFDYLRTGRGASHGSGLFRRVSMLSVIFLFLSSLGAWGISVVGPLGMGGENLIDIFKHMFLSYFTEGWLTLAAVAVLIQVLKPELPKKRTLAVITILLFVGIGLSPVLGMPSDLLSETAMMRARAGALLAGIGLLLLTVPLWRAADSFWKVPVLALGLKGAALAILAPLAPIWWADNHQDRVLFLHLLLLGIVTVTIVLALAKDHDRWVKLFVVSCVTLIFFLLPPSTLWPFSFPAGIWLKVIGPLSLLPALAAIPILLKGGFLNR